MSRATLLRVDHLTMRFGGLTAVNDASFSLIEGEITALIGPNGAGKTTLFNCITGFYRPSSGRIAYARRGTLSQDAIERATVSSQWSLRDGGTDVFLLERMPCHAIAHQAGVVRAFQNIRLFSGMTALENLLVAQQGHALWRLASRAAQRAAIDKARFWLDRIGLESRADDAAGALPYGDQRRLEIARAMCASPRLLCLDEPAAGLNPRESAELTQLLSSIRSDGQTSILLIEHDMSVVMQVSDHIVVLEYGQVIADGAPKAIRNDPRVIAAYLGVESEEETSA